MFHVAHGQDFEYPRWRRSRFAFGSPADGPLPQGREPDCQSAAGFVNKLMGQFCRTNLGNFSRVPKIAIEAGAFYVFDRGYLDFARLYLHIPTKPIAISI